MRTCVGMPFALIIYNNVKFFLFHFHKFELIATKYSMHRLCYKTTIHIWALLEQRQHCAKKSNNFSAHIHKSWCQNFPCKWLKACMNIWNTQNFTEVGNKAGTRYDKVYYFWKGILSLHQINGTNGKESPTRNVLWKQQGPRFSLFKDLWSSDW